MKRRHFLSHLAANGCLGAFACVQSGCGTLLHSERVGQPHSHQIDWKVVALDGLGLLLFFVPGVAAFAVDFCTGAIYLPYDEYYPPYVPSPQGIENRPSVAPPYPPRTWENAPPPIPTPATMPQANQHLPASSAHEFAPPGEAEHTSFGLRLVRLSRGQLEPQALERVVSGQVGRRISLEDRRTRLSVLPQLDQFHKQRCRHEADQEFGFAASGFFERFHQV